MANVFGNMFSVKLSLINLLAIPERRLSLHTSGLVPNSPILSDRCRQVAPAQFLRLGSQDKLGLRRLVPWASTLLERPLTLALSLASHPSSCLGAWKEPDCHLLVD